MKFFTIRNNEYSLKKKRVTPNSHGVIQDYSKPSELKAEMIAYTIKTPQETLKCETCEIKTDTSPTFERSHYWSVF